MRSLVTLCAVSTFLGWITPATAGTCPGNPDALGTERVITVDPTEHPRIGTMQYPESLPLADKEVVLTFDDGPVPIYTDRILETLAAECVKATFFVVGRQARAYPAEVRKVYNEGHTVASHSQTHPLIFTRLPVGAAVQEIEQGAASVSAALGDPRALAPFFRFPGLGRSRAIEAYLANRQMMVWSADFPADDWTHISGDEVMRRALERIERRGKGILLLHDIQPATALMLPHLLRELKTLGYHIVQVVPSGPDRPRTVTEPESWVMHKPKPTIWPMLVERAALAMPAPSLQSFGWPRPFHPQMVAPMPVPPGLVAGLVQGSETPEAPVRTATTAREMDRTAPIETYATPAEVTDESWFSIAADDGPSLVAPDEIFSSMIPPPAFAARPKPRPASIKQRPTALLTHGPSSGHAPPMPRAKFVSRWPSPAELRLRAY